MKLQVCSDLHLEFYEQPLHLLAKVDFAPDLDFLALPGDIVVPCRMDGKNIQRALGFLSTKARHVIFVIGNHEYYGGSREQVEFVLGSYMPKNFIWLRNNDVTVDGVHFFGGPLWFPNLPLNQLYERALADFSEIRGDFRTWVYEENRQFREKFTEVVTPQTVVISHHLPHPRSTPLRFTNSQINRFFVSDETNLITEKQPRLWIHGHTHNDCDYMLGETRVVCYPYAYPHERQSELFMSLKQQAYNAEVIEV